MEEFGREIASTRFFQPKTHYMNMQCYMTKPGPGTSEEIIQIYKRYLLNIAKFCIRLLFLSDFNGR